MNFSNIWSGVQNWANTAKKSVGVGDVWSTLKTKATNANNNYKAKEQAWQQRLGGTTGQDYSELLGGINTAVQAGSALFGKQQDDPQLAGEQAVSKALSAFGPYGQIASILTSVSSKLTRELGSNIGNVSKDVNDIAGGDKFGRVANNVLGGLSNMTLGGGSVFAKELGDFNVTSDMESMFGAYGDTARQMKAAEKLSGKNVLFNKGEYSHLVNNSILNQDLITNLKIGNEKAISSVPYNARDIETRNFRKINGMTGQTAGVTSGKQGLKLLSRSELDKIYSAKKVNKESEEDVQKFQNGGSILIPDGKLHAHKHHMEDVHPELAEDLTKKGIPVIATDDRGEITQVAEIEKQEIILEKSLTDKIEELWKDGSEEAMIKAGKLIVKTLFNNCDDNANLIEEVQYEKDQT